MVGPSTPRGAMSSPGRREVISPRPARGPRMSEPSRTERSSGDLLGPLPAEVERVADSPEEGACWSLAGEDLDVNLVAWSPPHGVPAHVNDGVDELVIGIRGRGVIEVDGRSIPLVPGGVHLVPRGARRAIRAETRLVYLTCHRRRPRTFASEELVDPGVGPVE